MPDRPAKPAPTQPDRLARALDAAGKLRDAGLEAEADQLRELAEANERLVRARRPQRRPPLRSPRMELLDG